MRKSKRIYLLVRCDWESTEVIRAYAKKEDAERHRDSANAAENPKGSFGKPYAVEITNYIYEE